MSLPFEEIKVSKNSFLRSFASNTADDELYWHMDRQDRSVVVISGEGWFFQEEDKVPVKLAAGDSFFIKKKTWHRVIRGTSPLKLYIREENE